MLPVRRTQDSWLPDIFNDFFDNSWMTRTNYTAPAINVIETDKEYEVELAAPGLDKEDFKVHVDEEGFLHIANSPTRSSSRPSYCPTTWSATR